jgi:hypothetical protein
MIASLPVETVELSVGDMANCSGCLLCLRVNDGLCVAKDKQESLRRKAEGRDLVVFLAPALFGQCSSTNKNAIDKGVALWFGAGAMAPAHFIVGYGADLDDEEKATFIDCVRKHLGKADVIHPEFREFRIEAFVSRSIRDNEAIAWNFVVAMGGGFLVAAVLRWPVIGVTARKALAAMADGIARESAAVEESILVRPPLLKGLMFWIRDLVMHKSRARGKADARSPIGLH